MAPGSQTWASLNTDKFTISGGTEKFIQDLSFKKMTPVQAVVIPLFVEHKDVCVEACTGSGKTMAFLVPVVELLLRAEDALNQIGAVILAPTRELAQQIEGLLKRYLSFFSDFESFLFVGGGGNDSVRTDIEEFDRKRAARNVIVATPGRLTHLLDTSSLSLKHTEVLVLDEADRLLALGFEQNITQIFHLLPKQRRTGLFSATLSSELKKLIKVGLRNPVHIQVAVDDKQKPAEEVHALPATLCNSYVEVRPENKLGCLVEFLRREKKKKIIVFFLTCACVDYFYKVFKFLGFSVTRMHGQMPQKARKKTYDKFCADGGILFATDVMARGVDIPDVEWIVQIDPPLDPTVFIHRIGRTARAGKAGQSVLFLLPNETSFLSFLEKREVPLRKMELNGDDTIIDRVRANNEQDRICLLKSSQAFVSYIRAYQEHQLNFLFQLKNLPIGYCATGYGLLRLPRMKEILGRKWEGFTQSKVNPHSIAFADPKREEQRLEKMAKKEEEYQEAEKTKREMGQKEMVLKERTRTEKRKAKRRASAMEWDELAAEERLAKKLRRKKISESEYEQELRMVGHEGDEDLEEEEDSSCGEEDSGTDAKPKQKAGRDESMLPPKWIRKKRRRGKKS